jgi:hypothetical protein
MRGHPESNGPRASPRYLANSLFPSNNHSTIFLLSPYPLHFRDCITYRPKGRRAPQYQEKGAQRQRPRVTLGYDVAALGTAAKEGGVALRGDVTNWRFGLGERQEGL